MFLMSAKPVVKDAHLLAAEDVYTQLLDALPPTISSRTRFKADNDAMNAVLARAMCLEPDERCSVEDLDRMLSDVLSENAISTCDVTVHRKGGSQHTPFRIFRCWWQFDHEWRLQRVDGLSSIAHAA